MSINKTGLISLQSKAHIYGIRLYCRHDPLTQGSGPQRPTLQYLKHVSSAVLWSDDEVDVSLVSQKCRVGYVNQQPGVYQVDALVGLEAGWNAGICTATEL